MKARLSNPPKLFDKNDPPRRLRFAPPNPAVARLVPQEADFLIFEIINRHGPLPIHYLYEFTKGLRTSYQGLQRRLTEFYNGDATGRPYLIRPRRQYDAYEARYQPSVYDLAPRAKVALAERRRLASYPPVGRDPFIHQLFQAMTAASLELTAPTKGIRYIPREEILREAGNPIALPIANKGIVTKLVPDDLFGFEYPDGGLRYFALEVDRNTESISSKNPEYTAFGKKVANYFRALNDRLHQAWWGIPNLSILTVTTNGTHVKNIIEHIEGLNERRFTNRFAFAVEPSFGDHWSIPKGILTHLLDETWVVPGGTKDISQP